MENQGIVIFQAKDLAKVVLPSGEERYARVSGKFRQQAIALKDYPIVGDRVVGHCYDQNQFLIDAVLPRKSFLQRKVAGNRLDEQGIAANVTTVFLTTSANEEFNLARLERFVTIVWDSGANPVIVLTKIDQIDAKETAAIVDQLKLTFGLPVLATTIYTDERTQFDRFLTPESIVAFIGSSGVGKSSLLNQLLGDERQTTSAIREEDGRGRHTTTSRQLFRLPNGAMVIDTPGMREISLETVTASSLDRHYQTIERLAENCRFKNCRHETEPNCAVKEALASGELSQELFNRYRKMEKEMAYLKRKEDFQARKRK
ncbi:ribosome small subunit-dependent GTPase A [Enterococcus sp.]|uniref:ribosome small subunit-dependent GTPase A n=1 Tax=Enterococcus sp. TaxID=35783 RepID=UPI0025C2FDB4|nr:ribosome small subunit-dependent GTPase A [Enterococcus sp.]